MRFLVRLRPTGKGHDRFLSSMRSLARSLGVEARNPKWTTYGALELDLFCKVRGDLDLFLAAASPMAEPEFVTDLNRAAEHISDAEILTKAKVLFNAERYWECHEVLEGLWRQKQGDEKKLLQGIILVCAAFVHYQKGEEKVALSVLARAASQLESPRESYGGFRLPLVRSAVQRILAERRFSIFTL